MDAVCVIWPPAQTNFAERLQIFTFGAVVSVTESGGKRSGGISVLAA